MGVEPRTQNPYPGPRPFEPGEPAVFCGRDYETRELLSLVIAHQAVLLYSQSGAGKTSLLNAGLMRLLREESFQVLPVARVRGLIPEAIRIDEVPNVPVLNTLISWAEKDTDPKRLVGLSISEFLSDRRGSNGKKNEEAVRVMVFDQFEELFTFHSERWRDREPFFQQLSEALEADPLLRLILGMREEYLGQLNVYCRLLPEKLETRFRLERLGQAAARAAIVGPLKNSGQSFAGTAADKLVQDLLKVRVAVDQENTTEVVGEYIEPVQLQVVCHGLLEDLPAEVKEITVEHLQTFGDVTEALSQFYEKSIKETAQRACLPERKLREWFERALITPAGTRGTVFRGPHDTGGMPNAAVDLLENRHILRCEARAGAAWYELTHDRFIDPILRSNAGWRRALGEADLLLQRLQGKADRWRQRGDLAEDLLDEAELQEMQQGVEIPDLECSDTVREFVRASMAEVQRKKERQQHIEEQARAGRRFRRLAAAAGLVAALAVVSLGVTVKTSSELKRRNQIYLSHNLAAAAISNLDLDPERSVLLAIQAASVGSTGDESTTPEAEDALHRAVAASRLRLTLAEHSREVSGITFSPDGTRIATSSLDGTIKIWDAESGKVLSTLNPQAGEIYDLAYSPDGKRLVTAGEDGSARVWDTDSGRESLKLAGHASAINAVAFSPEGMRVATASLDTTAKIWDATSGKELRTLSGHKREVYDISFSPDGKRVATASLDGTAKIWDAKSGRELRMLAGEQGELYAVAFSPDGSHAVTGGQDRTAKIWDLNSGKEPLKVSGHSSWVLGAVFSPNGKYLATASADLRARVRDASTGKLLFTLAGHDGWVQAIAFSPDGKHIATASADHTAKVWDAGAGEEVMTLTIPEVFGVAYNEDGKRLVAATTKAVSIWDSSSGKMVSELAVPDTVSLSTVGKFLATSTKDGKVTIQDGSTGELLRQIKCGTGENVESADLDAEGKQIVVSDEKGNVKICDAFSGAELRRWRGAEGRILSVSFSPDAKRIATANQDGTAKLWDTGGQKLFVLSGRRDPVSNVLFSHDGKRLATVGQANTATLWDADAGTKLVSLVGHSGPVNYLDFTMDGKRVATASEDKTAKVWDAETGNLMFTFSGAWDSARDVIFSPDKIHMATASGDGTVRVYTMKVQELLTIARKRVTRSLTADECAKYLHGSPCPASPQENR
jgi:WD40 repeat protein